MAKKRVLRKPRAVGPSNPFGTPPLPPLRSKPDPQSKKSDPMSKIATKNRESKPEPYINERRDPCRLVLRNFSSLREALQEKRDGIEFARLLLNEKRRSRIHAL